MLKRPPVFEYKGITIVLSNGSRFDLKSNTLLSAGGGRLVDECLRPDYNLAQCDVRVKEDLSPLLPGTKVIILLGENAAKLWLQNTDNTIGEIRGSIFKVRECYTIPTFYAQDAADFNIAGRNLELRHNAESYESIDDEDETGDDDADPKRRHGKTKGRNYDFWIRQDFKKIKYILQQGEPPRRRIEPNYIISPPSQLIIEKLRETKDTELFIDLETWFPSCDVKCCSFSLGASPDIYSFPWFDSRQSIAYSNLPSILLSLARAMKDNTTVAHNGQGFDFFVLAWKYGIPIGKKAKDTMIMQHRIFSDVEKSLGHLTSLWTYEPFHKDEGNVGYNNGEQVRRTLEYCAKDVYTMKLCYYSMMDYAQKIPGLVESMDRANNAIRPYLTTMLQGMAYDEEERVSLMKDNDRWMNQFIRWSKILAGEEKCKELRGKGKSSLIASPTQCVKYFHEELGYPVVGKGKEKQDGTRGASLGAKNMFKLRLKHENPMIDIILQYRELAKESGSLKFQPWDINNKIVTPEMI